ncbi:MAG: hypoxanthine phosphoribosyltransferase, partial [Thermodesulfovibrionia bacterium]|nr:hypoxanthine phosphoribosyltransferase [Thermodesulfovibrionia bacterium]
MITGKPLFTVEHIQNRVKELASKISEDYEGKELFSVGILRGAFMFFADIVKLIQIPMTIDFINVSSYAKTASTGEITVHTDLRDDIAGKHVLLIEDIIDTGLTLRHIREMLLKRDPASLKICVFLDKKS